MIILLLLSAFQLFSENDVQKIEINENLQQKASPWWSSNIVNLIGICIGICLILLQSWLQHKNSMKLQDEDYRNKYYLEIYKEFSTLANKAKKDSGKILAEMVFFTNELIEKLKLIDSGFKIAPPEVNRIFELSDSFFKSQNNYSEIDYLIEKYKIVIPRFDIFKNAFNSIILESTQMITELKDLLFTLAAYDSERVKKINASMNSFNVLIATQIGYVYDLENELQNTLLSKLFKNKVLKRIPDDSNMKVITTDESERENLMEYFKKK